MLVGDVGLNLKRGDLYEKEIDFLISCSYGPGRYDPQYEEGGQDYPLPYVRWTEGRNMEEYLKLLSERRVSLENLQPKSYPVAQAAEAYAKLKQDPNDSILAILEYPQSETALERKIYLPGTKTAAGPIRVALAGAGNFAQGMHLPNLQKLKSEFALRCVMSRTGASARAAATRFGATYATTDWDEILNDIEVDLVIIATRHDLHGRMVLEALQAGKHVFVEKPLAISRDELDAIEQFYREGSDESLQGKPLLMTGFNRRFAPATKRIQEILTKRTSPVLVNYRMNAGYLPREHWVHGEEGGGRNIGEACHIYDLFNALTRSEYLGVAASCIVAPSPQWKTNDNFVANISYADGSLCSLTYTALGSSSYAKESMEIFVDGMVISMRDFKTVEFSGHRAKGYSAAAQDKGQANELKALGDALSRGKPWPISLADQMQATRISFEVEEQVTPAKA